MLASCSPTRLGPTYPGSVAADDPFKEDVKVNMADTGLVGWLMRVVNVQGMDADATSINNSYMPTNNESVNGKDEKRYRRMKRLPLIWRAFPAFIDHLACHSYALSSSCSDTY